MLRSWTLALTLSTGLSFSATADDALDHFDLDTFMEETQQVAADPDLLSFAWWIPTEFWVWSMQSEGDLPEETIQEVADLLAPYIVIVAVDGHLGPFGGAYYSTAEEIRESARLTDRWGDEYPPLPTERISPDVLNLISFMQPMLGAMLGDMGENMNFLVFPGSNRDDFAIVDSRSEGSFALALEEIEFTWRTPLEALLPPRECPVDGARMSGSWKFCPWHGEALE